MMKLKKIIVVLLMCGMFNVVSLGQASDLPTCGDLNDIANSLEEMVSALEEVGTVNEGDEIDKALEEVIDGLSVIADAEDSRQLSQSVEQLSTAWEEMDGDQLMTSLNDVIRDFDVIYARECDN